MFRKVRIERHADKVEERFQTIVELIKDLEKKEFNRLVEGITLAWEAYNKVRQARPVSEKEVADIDDVEKMLSED